MKTDTETTTAHTQCADVAQQAEQRSRKATVPSSILGVGSILAAVIALMMACTPINYAKALDKCAFDHAGDRAGTVSCQCDVSQQYGRSCDWLNPDSGEAGVAPTVKEAGE